MTMFFSVDVETSNLTPWSPDGFLLTVGAVAVEWDPDDKTVTNVGEFHVRIDRSQDLDSYWYDLEDNQPPSNTAAWWREQNEPARNDAWADTSLVRHSDQVAAKMFREFVVDYAVDDDACFVANPVAFDKMWCDQLFADGGVENPFHYRSLCLRSMRFGLDKHSPWGATRDDHEPTIPHHALCDARAQAEDLKSLLLRRDR